MTDQVTDYQDARRSLDVALRTLEATKGVVRKMSDALSGSWSCVMISNGSGGFPMEVAMSKSAIHIDAKEWPTIGQIENALIAAHSAQAKVNISWAHLPVERRTGLEAPQKTRG